MRSTNLVTLLRSVHGRNGDAVSDGDLLDEFITTRAAGAFETLVRRHGSMVYHVCRRILQNDHEAEDAFQATFLVLVERAERVWPRAQVGNWLYGVACRVARKAHGRRARLAARQRAFTDVPASNGSDDLARAEVETVLHEEIELLPGKYREAVVLCYLQGKTYDEAAQRLACPKGTVATRLSVARERLQRRLCKRGVTVSSALLGTLLACSQVKAAVPAALVLKTVSAAGGLALSRPALSALVTELVREVLQERARQWAVRAVLGVLLVAGAAGGIAIGVSGLRNQAAPSGPPARVVSSDDLLFAAAPWEGEGPAIDPADQKGFVGEAPRDQRKPASGVTPMGVRWKFDPLTRTMTIDGTKRDDSLSLSRDKDGTLVIGHRNDWLTRRNKQFAVTDTGVLLGKDLNIVLNGNAGHDRIASYPLHQSTDFRRLTVNGGAGNDELVQWGPLNLEAIAAGDVILNGGDGADTIRAHGSRVTASGDAGVDQLIFDAPNIARIHGGGQQDVFYLYALPPGGPDEDAFYIKQLPDFTPAQKDVFGILNHYAF